MPCLESRNMGHFFPDCTNHLDWESSGEFNLTLVRGFGHFHCFKNDKKPILKSNPPVRDHQRRLMTLTKSTALCQGLLNTPFRSTMTGAASTPGLPPSGLTDTSLFSEGQSSVS